MSGRKKKGIMNCFTLGTEPAAIGKRFRHDVGNRMWVSCILVSCLCSQVGLAQVVFPQPQVVGQMIDKVENWMIAPSNSVYPNSIQLELNNGRISAVVCEYPERELTYSAIRSQIQKELGIEPRVSDTVTTAWRQDKKKYAIMVTHDREKKLFRIVLRYLENKKAR